MASGQVRLQWLGQSSFLVDGSEGRIGLDLYLSDHLEAKYRGSDKPHDRLHPCPVAPSDLADLRWVFASHKHSDHLDPGSIAEVLDVARGAELVLPVALVEYAVDELGLSRERLRGVKVGDRVGPFTILPASHPERTEAAVSTLIDVGGLRIFHSGDTLSFDELRDELVAARPDVLLLPANGRVAEHLGTPPNMSLEEGVELAAACGGLIIPHHYELFAFNSRPVAEVRQVLEESQVPHLIAEVGETIDLRDALRKVAA
jgi:L-ascorbate metabolism protein UlaG (beta-lactamase superfamily)